MRDIYSRKGNPAAASFEDESTIDNSQAVLFAKQVQAAVEVPDQVPVQASVQTSIQTSIGSKMDDMSSVGQASAAVAMANDAIDNARRAAASSRNRRAAASTPPPRSESESFGAKPLPSVTPQTPRQQPIPGTAEFVRNDTASPQSMASKLARNFADKKAPSTDLDLNHNDNAFHVVATLVTDRLLPKLAAGATHFSLTPDDSEFFQQMLPYSVRRSFVDALRYRLQLIKSGDPLKGNIDSPLGRLTMQCQLLGLDRDRDNVLLELSQSSGRQYPVNLKNQGPVAAASPTNLQPQSNFEQDFITQNRDSFENQIRLQQEQMERMQQHQYSAPVGADAAGNMAFLHSPTISPNGGGLDPIVADWETTAESLARQQIMAEINETKFLMRGSVTPEAVSFWKRHLDELQQRLEALNMKEHYMRTSPYNHDNVTMDYTDMDMYSKVKKHYSMPVIPSREEYLENNRKMREEAFGGPEGTYQPPVNIIDAKVHAIAAERTQTRSPVRKQEELPVCDVVAPSDLPGGYMFEAQLGTKKFLATVPPGGVTKGQRFVSTMRELETIEIPVPLGQWRDDTCECFSDGLLHPLFLNTVLFPCIALGQIMSRTGLDWFGDPTNKLVSGLSCANMSVLYAFWLAINASATFMIRIKWERGVPFGPMDVLPVFFFNIFMLAYMVFLVMKVRQSIRNKYQIPEDRCVGCEDCVCATFCTSCTICQMGRHTADFDTYRGTCCTRSGLPRQVELAPVTFYEDQYQNVDSQTSHVV